MIGNRFAIASLAVLALGCSDTGAQTEIYPLDRVQSPDGRHVAQVDQIVGGPPIGGAVIWQELHVLTPYARDFRGPADTMLALTCNDESRTPCVSVHWESPNRLLVTLLCSQHVKTHNTTIDGVEIFYVEGAAPASQTPK